MLTVYHRYALVRRFFRPFFVTIGVEDTLGGGSGQLINDDTEGSIKYVGETGSTVSTNLNECLVIVKLVTGLRNLAPPL